MKVNETTQITTKRIILVPYEKKHVLRYHEWMKSPELQELTASEPLTQDEEYAMQESWRNDDNKCTFIVLCKEDYDMGKTETECMVGDVNLFLNDDDDQATAEVEIMIAEKSVRGKGMGKEAVYSMMRYGVENLNLKRYTAKIGYSNQPSIQMFQKIGFTETSRSDVFQEVTLELKITEDMISVFRAQTEGYTVQEYQPSETKS